MLSNEAMVRLGRLTRDAAAEPVRPGRASRRGARGCRVAEAEPPVRSDHATTSEHAEGGDTGGRELRSSEHAERLAGREVENPAGTHWLIEHPLDQLWPASPRYLRRHAERLQAGESSEWSHPHLEHLARGLPSDLLLLDLETCGFAGSMVFLVGVLYERRGALQLAQFLARNYAEERAMLYSLWQLVPGKRLLVTFNGKSFDWPVIRDRTTLHRLSDVIGWSVDEVEEAYRQPGTHCDVLHHARRHWKGRLPNYRLQTLERHICGRRREGDIPGRLIPDAYHRFVRCGEVGQMRSILHHNALDLVTLFQLSLALA